tara:strand:+ start:22368 stop:22769 length:402 start_codon:yes stop_codon:yes gene_type:complete
VTLDIYDAFGVKLNTFAANLSPARSVNYIGSPVTFVPPSTGEWLEAAVFWNGHENYAWGEGPSGVDRGFFRVGVVTRAGIQAAQPIAELLVTEFKKLTVLATALVDRMPELSGPLQEDDRLTVPVTIHWRVSR